MEICAVNGWARKKIDSTDACLSDTALYFLKQLSNEDFDY